ncbi:MAG: hypothetical protein ACD_62C00045G0006 [uncultured bacterium]|nr:MAG: hypothetical protein ACD_62C00045G0006 [uncultured bacterium]
MTDQDFQKKGSPEEGDEGAQDNLNATMMSIDVSNLNLSGADTKTEIKIEMPSDNEIIQEQLEQKKSPLTRFLHKLFTRHHEPLSRAHKALPDFLTSYENVWFCDPRTPILQQLFFYMLRLLILGAGCFLHTYLFARILPELDAANPAQKILVVLLGVDVLLVVLVLITKSSPSWLVSLPLSVLAVLFAYFATFLHTADPYLFAVNTSTISALLNLFYTVVMGYVFLISIFEAGERLLGKLFLGVLSVLCLSPMIICFITGLNLEMSFFGYGRMADWPHYTQPVFIVFHVLMPILFCSFFLMAILPIAAPRQKARRGVARSLAVLMLSLVIANFAFMQKNRVFHVFNLFMPQRLEVGGVLLEVLNHKLRVETKNFSKQAGQDNNARYQFDLNQGQKPNQFLLQVVDQFGFPVRGLFREDLEISCDGEKVTKIKFAEQPHMDPKKGNYLLEVDLKEKAPLLTWDRKKNKFATTDHVSFTMEDPSLVQRVLVKHNEEVLLDVENPKDTGFQLPLNYFNVGDYNLSIALFDASGQEVFNEYFPFSVQAEPDVRLLYPVDGDAVRADLMVLLLPKHLQPSTIQSVTYTIDNQMVFEVKQDFFLQTIDVSELREGEHTLKVLMVHEGGKISKKVKFQKTATAPLLHITKPAMGAYASQTAQISFELAESPDSKIAGIKLYVNGDIFQDFSVEEQGLSLPVSRWLQPEIYLTVQATLENGLKVSDWIQLNKGLGLLDVNFNVATLNFLNLKNVAVILDASISQLDNWHGKEKWRAVKKIVMDPDVDAKIKLLNPSYLVFGSQRPHYFGDCDDQQVLVKQGGYSKAFIKRQLSKLEPNGVSALLAALKEAYRQQPDKIYLFADNKDSCDDSFRGLEKLIRGSPQTQIVIFALGQITPDTVQWFEKLAEKTGGRLFQPENYDALKKNWLDEMVLSYELYSGDELVSRVPLGEKKYYLDPGEYRLQIPYGHETESMELSLENGSHVTLEITGEKGKIKVNQITEHL